MKLFRSKITGTERATQPTEECVECDRPWVEHETNFFVGGTVCICPETTIISPGTPGVQLRVDNLKITLDGLMKTARTQVTGEVRGVPIGDGRLTIPEAVRRSTKSLIVDGTLRKRLGLTRGQMRAERARAVNENPLGPLPVPPADSEIGRTIRMRALANQLDLSLLEISEFVAISGIEGLAALEQNVETIKAKIDAARAEQEAARRLQVAREAALATMQQSAEQYLGYWIEGLPTARTLNPSRPQPPIAIGVNRRYFTED